MKKLILIVFAAMLLAACKKELNTTTNSETLSASAKSSAKMSLAKMSVQDISVEDGRLNFNTVDAFQHLLEEGQADSSLTAIPKKIATIPHSKFVTYAERQPGGESVNNVRASAERPTRPTRPGTEPEIEQDSLIDDPLFSQVVNDKGELQVAGTLYKITQNGTFAVTPSSIAELNTMLDENGLLKSQYRNALQTVDAQEGYYRINDHMYFVDTYGVVRSNSTLGGVMFNTAAARPVASAAGTPRPCRQGCTVPTPTPNSPFSNLVTYDFEQKHGFFGNILQNIFGNPHYQYYSTPDRRLKVNFSSKNWLVYASLGVRAVIQKRTKVLFLSVWGPVENKDEMRLGWTPMIYKLDLPAFTIPGRPQYGDPFSAAGKMLANAIKIKFDGEYTTLRVSDILDANAAFPFLPSSVAGKLNSLDFDVNAFVNKKADQEAEQLFSTLKRKLGYTAPENKLAFLNNDRVMIENGSITHDSKTGNGAMSKTFSFNTAIVGFSSNGTNGQFIFKPAKKVELVRGSVYAVGKLNGEWRAIAVRKND